MRTVAIIDLKIDKDEALALLDDYSEFIEKHTGVVCEWYVERRDFSSVPTSPDNDGDLKPTYAYRQALARDVHDRYGDYGADNIVMWVHEDNFLFKGIWGVNYSYSHFKYCFQLCRWDKDNPANTFGTLYHEQAHSFDAVIEKETGVDIRPLLKVGDYDRDIVHGASDKWDYIRYQENTGALKKMAGALQKAYKVRKDKHNQRVTLMKTIVKLLSTVVSLLQKKIVLK